MTTSREVATLAGVSTATVSRVIVSGRLVYGWKFIKGPLHGAVGQGMAGRLAGWSVEPGGPTGPASGARSKSRPTSFWPGSSAAGTKIFFINFQLMSGSVIITASGRAASEGFPQARGPVQ